MEEYLPTQVPIAMIIYNRPETTRRVFARIKEARPTRLHIIADGPRADLPDDSQRCQLARSIIDQVDWDCSVSTDFSEINLGLKKRISSGLDHLFSFTDKAIILEDDCLPQRSFFPFCEELLSYYQRDERVMMIGGTNFFPHETPQFFSYRFSIYPLVWGWATWASAWEKYDFNMCAWPKVRGGELFANLFPEPAHRRYWEKRMEMTYAGRLDTWDYAWVLACWLNRGLSVIPNFNLIANIGFGSGATHTLGRRSRWMDLPVKAIGTPLSHPHDLLPDAAADRRIQEKVYREYPLAPLKKWLKSQLCKWRSG